MKTQDEEYQDVYYKYPSGYCWPYYDREGENIVIGTKYCNHDTTLEDLAQTIASYQSWFNWRENTARELIPFELSNTTHLISQYLERNRIVPSHINESDTQVDRHNSDSKLWCSVHKFNKDTPDSEFIRLYMSTLSFNLHDSAVTYTYKAAEEMDKDTAWKYANIACELWFFSRQLREGLKEHYTERYTIERVKEMGYKLTYTEIVMAFFGKLKSQALYDWRYKISKKFKSLLKRG